jgi:hypothetical protein
MWDLCHLIKKGIYLAVFLKADLSGPKYCPGVFYPQAFAKEDQKPVVLHNKAE